ncbi:MAG: hypothetical protein OXD54_09320 [Candidatus Poribacteria bacterium]|nr:hypothetical protein [Candidatus Poribacteria bacterium]
MGQFQFKFTDIFRVCRYGFSGRRIGLHLVGILLAYLLYEILVYLSLAITGGSEVNSYWDSYGLLPVPPFIATDLKPLTIGAMWFGIIIFASIFFLVSTMTSKITIEQLRGDIYFSVGDALKFIRHKWQTVIGSFLSLPFLILLLLMIPITVALFGRIPYIGKPLLIIASVFSPIAFFIGLLTAFIFVVFIASLFFMPAIVATTGSDAFETVYQLFSIVWNQPWRLVGYGILLFFLKLLLVPIWGIFCIAGIMIVLIPTFTLHTPFIQETIIIANEWLGGGLQKVIGFLFRDDAVLFGFDNTSQLPVPTISTVICVILLTVTLIGLASGVVAYLFSLASVGTTLIYVVIRKRLDENNLIEIIGIDGQIHTAPQHIGDE